MQKSLGSFIEDYMRDRNSCKDSDKWIGSPISYTYNEFSEVFERAYRDSSARLTEINKENKTMEDFKHTITIGEDGTHKETEYKSWGWGDKEIPKIERYYSQSNKRLINDLEPGDAITVTRPAPKLEVKVGHKYRNENGNIRYITSKQGEVFKDYYSNSPYSHDGTSLNRCAELVEDLGPFKLV